MVISNTRELEKLKDRIPNLINIARIAIVFPLMIMHILAGNQQPCEPARFVDGVGILCLARHCLLADFLFHHPSALAMAVAENAAFQRGGGHHDDRRADLPVRRHRFRLRHPDSALRRLLLPAQLRALPLLYASYAAILLIFNAIADGDIGKYPLISDARTASATFILVAASYLSAIFTSLSVKYIDRAGKLAHENHAAYRRIRGLNQTVLNRVQEAVVVINVEDQTILFKKRQRPATHA